MAGVNWPGGGGAPCGDGHGGGDGDCDPQPEVDPNSKLKVIPLDKNGELDLKEFKNLVSKKTKLVFLNHVSNALGIINPIEEIIQISHSYNALVLIDGAQSAAHFKIDLQKLNVDFFTASAHKLCGPTGVGFLYGKKELLEKIEPFKLKYYSSKTK